MFKNFKRKVYETAIIKTIKKTVADDKSFTVYVKLNQIEKEAAKMLLQGKISHEFYDKVFLTRSQKHYIEENAVYIMNYTN